MNMIRQALRAATIAWLLVPTIANAEDEISKDFSGNYLCKMTASAGIVFDETGKWVPHTLNVDDDAYIIKVADTGKTTLPDETDSEQKQRVYSIKVSDFRAVERTFPCFDQSASTRDRNQFTIDETTGVVSCRSFSHSIYLNLIDLKIQTAIDGGFMEGENDKSTASIAMGKCQRTD